MTFFLCKILIVFRYVVVVTRTLIYCTLVSLFGKDYHKKNEQCQLRYVLYLV